MGCMMKKTICELFAGVGGFRLGLEKSSKKWETVWFSQWEPNRVKQWAHDCYVNHWGDIDHNTGIDIALVDKAKIPDHNLLVGGFPCQDYSVARSLSGNKGIEGKKGVLWWQIRDTLEAKKPPFALFENVDRLLKSPASQRGRDFGVMLACLDALGYHAQWRVINAAEYGAGQRRRRIFIFVYHKTTNYAKKMASTSIEDILSSTGFFAKTFPVSVCGLAKQTHIDSKNIQGVSENFQYDFDNGGLLKDGTIYSSVITPESETPIPLRELLEKNVPEKYYLNAQLEKWEYLKGAKKVQRMSKSGYEYTFSEGPIAFPDPLDLPARTMLTSESSLNRSTHVICDPETNQLRLITPVEAERIQGFEDNWTNTGMPEKFRYFCMGNALVVPMVTRMGDTLNTIFNAE